MPDRLRVIEVDPNDAEPVQFEGAEYPTALPLATWIARLNGYEGELTDREDHGITYPISLEPWRGRDPETTWLQVIVSPD